jgi:chromosome segregation ATPase
LKSHEKSNIELQMNLTDATKQIVANRAELLRLQEELLSCRNKSSPAKDLTPVQMRNGTERNNDATVDNKPSSISSSPNLSLAESFMSPSKLSPSTTEIVTKHSELLQDLVKMKSMIHDAITPIQKVRDESILSEKGDDAAVSLLQEELHEKNKVLSLMEEQVDYLFRDISMAKQALSEKDNYLSILEKDKDDLISQLKNMQLYIKQVEQSLCTELKRRRKIENEYRLIRKENKSLLTEYRSKSEALREAKKELAKKSRDVTEQVDVARQLANQLQTTKNKIVALKAHLKREGLLQDTTPKAKRHASPADSTSSKSIQESLGSASSAASLCWTFSEDE